MKILHDIMKIFEDKSLSYFSTEMKFCKYYDRIYLLSHREIQEFNKDISKCEALWDSAKTIWDRDAAADTMLNFQDKWEYYQVEL